MPVKSSNVLLGRTYLSALVMETLEEALQQLVSVVDPLCIFTNDPDHGSTSVRLVQRVQVLTQCGNDAFIPEENQNLCFQMETLQHRSTLMDSTS